MNGKSFLLVLAAVLLFAGPAFAGDCDTAIAELDQKLATANVSEEVLNEVKIMRMQASQMCQAGQDAEATDIAQLAAELIESQ